MISQQPELKKLTLHIRDDHFDLTLNNEEIQLTELNLNISDITNSESVGLQNLKKFFETQKEIKTLRFKTSIMRGTGNTYLLKYSSLLRRLLH
jgi:hypothetical protein